MLDRAAVLGLVALLTWILVSGYTFTDTSVRDALKALDDYEASESGLHRDVLSARAGILNNYDPLVEHIDRMRTASERVGAIFQHMRQDRDANALQLAMQRQYALTEQFKSTNALLQNSLAYFGLFSARITAARTDLPLRRDVDRLSAAMLGLSLRRDEVAIDEVRERLTDLRKRCHATECDSNVQGLLTHGALLVRVLPDTALLIEQMVRESGSPLGRELQSKLIVAQQAAEDTAGRYRLLLYLGSILLAYLLVRAALQVRAKAALLKRQVALEHIIAEVSTHLTAAPPERLKRVVHESLGELAKVLGADCAWFRSASKDASYIWPTGMGTPSDCWAELLIARATPDDSDSYGVVQLSRGTAQVDEAADAALALVGVETCYCIVSPGSGMSRNLLAFGLPKGHECWAMRKLAVLNAALDSISLAMERAKLERERTRLEAQLGQTRRMETIGAFASGIAHNFNNLLGAISGHVEMASATVEGETAFANHLEQIRLSSDRGHQLVEAILNFGRRYDHNRQTTELTALVRESVSLAEAAIGSEHRIAVTHDLQALTVIANPAQLQQVILNLCHNAAQAMPNGGDIRVVLARHDTHETIAVGNRRLQPGSFAALDVIDSGYGIPASLLRKVFDPFFTTKASGTGLGLSTAREIVAEHGGALLLDSVPGEGTTVRVLLPLLAQEQSPALRQQVYGNGEVVQFVAPNHQSLALGEDLLAALGYEPIGYADLDAAKAALCETPARFDVLLIGGLALEGGADAFFADARAIAPDIPRLFAVMHADDYPASVLANTGVTAVLPFPLDPRELALALKDALAASGRAPPPTTSIAPAIV